MPSSQVMEKWETGKLHSGSARGPLVPKTKAGYHRAVAIMMGEKRTEEANGGTYPEPRRPRKKIPTRRSR